MLLFLHGERVDELVARVERRVDVYKLYSHGWQMCPSWHSS